MLVSLPGGPDEGGLTKVFCLSRAPPEPLLDNRFYHLEIITLPNIVLLLKLAHVIDFCRRIIFLQLPLRLELYVFFMSAFYGLQDVI